METTVGITGVTFKGLYGGCGFPRLVVLLFLGGCPYNKD